MLDERAARARRLRVKLQRGGAAVAVILAPLLAAVGPIRVGALMDFKGGVYDAGVAILHGQDPYRPVFLHTQAAIMHAGGIAVGESVAGGVFSVPLYPAPANLAAAPFGLLPLWLAGALFTALSLGAFIWALQLLGVRDWRCIALALLSYPTLNAFTLGAVGPLLLLGIALAWRWRDRLWRPAWAIALIVVVKLFPWPLVGWLAAMRRWRTLAVCVLLGTVVMFGAWALLGFQGMLDYPRMLSDATYIQEGRSVSLAAVLLALGASPAMAQAAVMLAAGAILALAWRVARQPGGDRAAFGLAIIAALTASPLIWDHYMVLLFAPIALLSPRLSALWILPTCSAALVVELDCVFQSPPLGPFTPKSVGSAVGWVLFQALLVVLLSRRPAVESAPAPVPASA
jgi:hypothetical protein